MILIVLNLHATLVERCNGQNNISHGAFTWNRGCSHDVPLRVYLHNFECSIRSSWTKVMALNVLNLHDTLGERCSGQKNSSHDAFTGNLLCCHDVPFKAIFTLF